MSDEDQTKTSRIARFAPKAVGDGETASWFVRPSVLFLGLGLVATVAIISWLGLFSSTEDIRLDVADINVSTDGNVELTGARYRGRLESGDSFEITADRASEDKDGSGLIHLEDPVASVYFADGSTTSASSDSGKFHQQRNEVDMTGSVVVTDYARETTLQTEALTANLETGTMKTDVAVEVRNPTGIITANAMQSADNGARITFFGNAIMTVTNAN